MGGWVGGWVLIKKQAIDVGRLVFCNNFFFFWIRGNFTLRKAYFVGSGEEAKPRLSQALIRGVRPNSNSKPVVQISNPLLSRNILEVRIL
jgi:hypothetical protein